MQPATNVLKHSRKFFFCVIIVFVGLLFLGRFDSASVPSESQADVGSSPFVFHGGSLGKVPAGITSKHTFSISHSLPNPISVRLASLSCGCISNISDSDFQLMPNETKEISYLLKVADDQQGDFERSIELHAELTDGLMNSSLMVSGEAVPVFAGVPRAIDFGDVARGMDVSRQVKLRLAEGSSLAIQEVSGTGVTANINVSPALDEIALVVKLSPTGIPDGPFRTEMKIQLDGLLKAEMVLPVVANILP